MPAGVLTLQTPVGVLSVIPTTVNSRTRPGSDILHLNLHCAKTLCNGGWISVVFESTVFGGSLSLHQAEIKTLHKKQCQNAINVINTYF